MTLKKKDLYNFIDDRKNDKLKEIDDNYKAKGMEIGEEVWNKISKYVELFNEAYLNLKAEYKFLNSWVFLKINESYYLREMLSKRNTSPEITKNKFVADFQVTSEKTYNNEEVPKEIQKLLKKYNQLFVKRVEEKDKVKTLHFELESVIKNETTAKRAKKTLEDLGLDLSDLKADEPCYPVVVKPSVDIKLFNNPNM